MTIDHGVDETTTFFGIATWNITARNFGQSVHEGITFTQANGHTETTIFHVETLFKHGACGLLGQATTKFKRAGRTRHGTDGLKRRAARRNGFVVEQGLAVQGLRNVRQNIHRQSEVFENIFEMANIFWRDEASAQVHGAIVRNLFSHELFCYSTNSVGPTVHVRTFVARRAHVHYFWQIKIAKFFLEFHKDTRYVVANGLG